jgi:S-adenosylmethionine synthetase
MSDKLYGLSNDGQKYYHILLNKISYNLLNRGFNNNISLNISSDMELNEIDSENINLNLIDSKLIDKEKMENLILDVFNFDMENLTNEFNLTDFEYPLGGEKIWENYKGTGDLMFL